MNLSIVAQSTTEYCSDCSSTLFLLAGALQEMTRVC